MKKSIIIIYVLLAACSQGAGPAPDKPIATVNNQPILSAFLSQTLTAEGWKYGLSAASDTPTTLKIKTQILESLIKDALLLEEAKVRNIDVAAEDLQKDVEGFQRLYQNEADWKAAIAQRGYTEERWKEKRRQALLIQKLVESFSQNVEAPASEEITRYYQSHRQDFVRPEEIRVRQIAVDSLEKAEGLRKQIVSGADFEKMARQFSLSPDRKNGGDLGFFAKGTMPKEFDDAGFSLKKGEVSEVIRSSYGYHVLQLLDRKPAEQMTLETVREKIASLLRQERGRAAFEIWYKTKRETAQIFINQTELESLAVNIQGMEDNE